LRVPGGAGSAGEAPLSGEEPERGTLLVAITNAIVGLHKEHYGRGPTRAKTYYTGDLIVCLMREGFSMVERTLFESGQREAVLEQRAAFQRAMQGRYTEAIERLTGRRVIAFMSNTHQDPDLVAEIFVLEANDILRDDDAPEG
jgi:uncharacterized protein YbcI